MSNFTDKFKGMAKAETQNGRVPNPSLGKGAYLVSTIRMHDARVGGGFRCELSLTALWSIAEGETWDHQPVPSNRAGDKVSMCFFSGERFLSDLKNFCLIAIGKEAHEEMEIADMLCPESEFPNKTPLERLQHMWEHVLPGMVCAFGADGKPIDAGIFDGQVVVEIGTTQKKVMKKIDKKGPDEKSNWMHGADGQPLSGIYDNSYVNRRIGFQEVGENLEEAEILRFFGTSDNFMELLKDHG